MVVNMNGAHSTSRCILALLRELSHVPRALTDINEPRQQNIGIFGFESFVLLDPFRHLSFDWKVCFIRPF